MLSFHVKFVQTDRRTDRRTTIKQYAPPIFRYGGIKNEIQICPSATVRYLYQPEEQKGGVKRGATYPIWNVDMHKIDYHIVTQGIRVHYQKPQAPKGGFVKEELHTVPSVKPSLFIYRVCINVVLSTVIQYIL